VKTIVAAALLGVTGSPAWSCEPGLAGDDVMRIDSARYSVALRSRPARIAVSEYFALDIAACGKNGAAAPALSRLEAHMPAHRHGMNYAPRIRSTAPGRWQADGLLFHMPGLWELRLDLRAAGVTERLSYNYRLE